MWLRARAASTKFGVCPKMFAVRRERTKQDFRTRHSFLEKGRPHSSNAPPRRAPFSTRGAEPGVPLPGCGRLCSVGGMGGNRAGWEVRCWSAGAPQSPIDCLRYGLCVARLLACPFCRSLFASAEAKQCPECGVKLVPMENLPESLDAHAEELAQGELVLPEQRTFPWNYFGRNRGALMVIALLGLALFFSPWVELRMPEFSVRSG